MATIAVVSADLGGHLGPCVRLSRALTELGHRVLVWAPESEAAQIRAGGAEPVAHQPAPLTRDWRGMREFAVRLAQTTLDCLPEFLGRLLAEDAVLVVADVHTPWGKVAAEYLGLPLIVSNPLFPVWSSPARAASRDRVASPAYRALRDALLLRWGVDLGRAAQAISITAPATISYTTPAVIGDAPPPPGWCLAGPLMPERPAQAAAERPLVYAALGTFSNRSRERFAAIVEAVGELDVDAVISTGGRFGAADFAPVPSNVTVEGHVDSRELLRRAAVQITHGGASSVHESLVAGVPLVCLPIGSDQPQWARRVVACGAGEVCGYDPPTIRQAVLRQLSPAGGRAAARAMSERLLSHPGQARVGDLIDTVLGAGPRPAHDEGGSGLSASSASGTDSRPRATGTS